MAIALQPKSLKAKLRRTLLPPAKVAKNRGRSKRSRAFLTRLRRLPTRRRSKEKKKRKAEDDKPKQKPLTEAERKDAEEVAGALGYRVE